MPGQNMNMYQVRTKINEKSESCPVRPEEAVQPHKWGDKGNLLSRNLVVNPDYIHIFFDRIIKFVFDLQILHGMRIQHHNVAECRNRLGMALHKQTRHRVEAVRVPPGKEQDFYPRIQGVQELVTGLFPG